MRGTGTCVCKRKMTGSGFCRQPSGSQSRAGLVPVQSPSVLLGNFSRSLSSSSSSSLSPSPSPSPSLLHTSHLCCFFSTTSLNLYLPSFPFGFL